MTNKMMILFMGVALTIGFNTKAEQSIYKTDAGDFFILDHEHNKLSFIDAPDVPKLSVSDQTLFSFKETADKALQKAKDVGQKAKEMAQSAFSTSKKVAQKTATVTAKVAPIAIKKAKELAQDEAFRKMAKAIFALILEANDSKATKKPTKSTKGTSSGSGISMDDFDDDALMYYTPEQKKKLEEALKGDLSEKEKGLLEAIMGGGKSGSGLRKDDEGNPGLEGVEESRD